MNMVKGKLYDYILDSQVDRILDEAKKEAETKFPSLLTSGWYSNDDIPEFRDWFIKWFGEAS